MTDQKLYIKNMVCDRCKLVVKQQLEKLGLETESIELGEAELTTPPTIEQREEIRNAMKLVGFELMDDKKSQVVEKIKSTIIELIHGDVHRRLKITPSDYIAQHVGRDYSYLSNLFSETVGTTIEQYMIHQKIERVKELLVYGQLNLSEIADQLGYSSVAHLSGQFKKVTGLTPSHFKTIGENKRKPLDQV